MRNEQRFFHIPFAVLLVLTGCGGMGPRPKGTDAGGGGVDTGCPCHA
jgi:hypothetical protein